MLGADPAEAGGDWRDRIGVVLQESQPEPGLTVRECLELYAGYYRAPREIGETIELVGLEGKSDTVGEQLSGGQRRRLDVALSLIGDPELIFLDEPTTGFDPSARRAAWEVVSGLRELGKTVFLTTHYMDEAENLADRVAVIAGGRIVAEGTPDMLGGREQMPATIAFTLPDRLAPGDLPPGLLGLAASRIGQPDRSREPPSAGRRQAARRLGAGARARSARPRRAPAVPGGRLPAADRQPASEAVARERAPAVRGARAEDDAARAASGALRPAELPAQPAVAVLHADPAGAVPGHLRQRVRQPQGRPPAREGRPPSTSPASPPWGSSAPRSSTSSSRSPRSVRRVCSSAAARHRCRRPS